METITETPEFKEALRKFWEADPNLLHFEAMAWKRRPDAQTVKVVNVSRATSQPRYRTLVDGKDLYGGEVCGPFIPSPPRHYISEAETGEWSTENERTMVWPQDNRTEAVLLRALKAMLECDFYPHSADGPECDEGCPVCVAIRNAHAAISQAKGH